jgi:hypothetical protein
MVQTLRLLERRLRGAIARHTFAVADLPADPSPWLWSKGVARLCDFHGPADYWLAPTESVQNPSMFRQHYGAAHGLVWLRLGTRARDGTPCDIDHFVGAALPTIHRPFVLITTDGDAAVPSELPTATVRSLIESPWLVAWHTQNHDGSGPAKIAPFPIGLDLHTPRPFTSPRRLAADLRHIAATARPVGDRPLVVFSDIGLSLASVDRRAAVAALADLPHVSLSRRRVSQQEIWRRYAGHAFVLSLRGNGLDCHRTWEALYLGCIVITRTSSLDPLFEGLPVVRIGSWDEIRNPANLSRWRDQYGPLASTDRMAKLDAPAYVDRIRRAHRLVELPA